MHFWGLELCSMHIHLGVSIWKRFLKLLLGIPFQVSSDFRSWRSCACSWHLHLEAFYLTWYIYIYIHIYIYTYIYQTKFEIIRSPLQPTYIYIRYIYIYIKQWDFGKTKMVGVLLKFMSEIQGFHHVIYAMRPNYIGDLDLRQHKQPLLISLSSVPGVRDF